MPTLTIKGQTDVELEEGANLLTFLQENNWDQNLPATCGGRGTCATCAVRVEAGGGEPNAAENTQLKDRIERGWRLSCQIDIEDDLVVEVPGYEVAESLEIEPGLLVDILDFCLDRVPLESIPSSERIDRNRVLDLRQRTVALVEGGGDPADYIVLANVITYLLEQRVERQGVEHPLWREVASNHPFTAKTLEMMVQNFAQRIPRHPFV